ncbi:MAG: 3-dehydroquinate synthase [Candidatus Hydrogenedentota bacterium]
MQPKTLHVALGERTYPIHTGLGNVDTLPALIEATGCKGAIGVVSDSNVWPHYGERIAKLITAAGKPWAAHVIPAGETHKRLDEIEKCCGTFLEAGLDRASLIIGFGGGVPGDMAGFTAAVFMRGVPFIQIPTTIVAQVDSSVGGKTGVNHPLSKNSIGAFHQPLAVLIDMELLVSLPERELHAGLAEVIKHGIIADADLFEYMEENAPAILARDLEALAMPVVRSCEIKAAVVAADEREQGVRANLNYGHTFGHGIEAATHYAHFLHGEAVALGMVAAGALGQSLGMVDEAFVARQRACIAAYGLPTAWPELPVHETLTHMRKDKKARAGTMKFIVPAGVGRVEQRTDISEAQARAALEALRTTA